ncbi:MAG: RNA polymerase sporulation sigma factor SigK [Blautia sp.]|nr:RNA polymerase sporulation sigma factor SigK [Blautia sp.]MDY4514938.1 RNA polymerase sporulation sigma factor SigK [Lachnospiraceae bacterium]
MKTFPKPLTAEEEKLYLKRYKDGDQEARRILIERNLRLVAHVAKKYQGSDEDSDDLISIGTIGLIKAVSTFDSSKKNRLATYAARCIDNELLMMLRMRKKTSKEVSLYEPIGTDREGNEINLLDIIEGESVDIPEIMDLEADTRRLYQILGGALTQREKEVLRMRYGLFGTKEKTQREIAEQMGISRSYVSRIEKTALNKLKAVF